MGLHHGQANFVTYGKPSLFLDFANKKSLTDRISGNNLIDFTRSSVGTYVGADGLIKTASADEPRFDHDANGNCLGLLIEESRTNFVANSTGAQGLNITPSYLTISSVSNIISPDGTTNGVIRYTTSGGSGTHRFPISWANGTANTTYTGSIWARAVNTSATFSIDVIDRNATAFTVDEKWTRVSVSAARSDVGYRFFDVNAGDNQDLYLWGPQIEAGSFPTSYIPTSGSTVTRSADTAQITGTNFSSFYNQSASTFYLESTLSPAIAAKKYFTLYDNNTASEIIEIATQEVGKVNVFTYDSSTTQSDVRVTSSTNAFKSAAGIVANNVNISVNGTLGTADTSATQPSGINRLYLGTYVNGSNVCNCPIKQLIYYPTRLTNAQLQSLTS